jgi:murein tripeptide amidase MpaA
MNATGVDINRNFDFLWASGVGSSFFPIDDTYKGTSPFSEPETRNMKWLLEQSRADFFLDIHGYAGQVDQSWGDALNQTLDSTMSFRNPLWDGRRVPPYNTRIH